MTRGQHRRRMGMFRSFNSVIPTGADHRAGDDLSSGWTLCFWETRREDLFPSYDRKVRKAARRFCPSVVTDDNEAGSQRAKNERNFRRKWHRVLGRPSSSPPEIVASDQA